MIALGILALAACYGVGHLVGGWSQRRRSNVIGYGNWSAGWLCDDKQVGFGQSLHAKSAVKFANGARAATLTRARENDTWDELTTRIEKKPARKRKR